MMRGRRRAGGALALFSVMAAVALLPCARAVAVNLTVKAPLDIGLAPSYVRASYLVVVLHDAHTPSLDLCADLAQPSRPPSPRRVQQLITALRCDAKERGGHLGHV